MARIVLHAAGTPGELPPFTNLGRALADRGHRVTLAVSQQGAPGPACGGLEILSLAGADKGTQARGLAEVCGGADFLVSTPLGPLGRIAHEAAGVSWCTLSTTPSLFWRPESARERKVGREAALAHYRALRARLLQTYRELGIAAPIPEWSETWAFARHVLLASSVHFSRTDPALLQPRHSIDLTGYLLAAGPPVSDWNADAELEAFCGRRPLLLELDSRPPADPERFLALHVEAAARLGMPLLVLGSWANQPGGVFSPARGADVLHRSFIPGDWVYARAACAIQGGGSGSIAGALRQGCPLLIEPSDSDQIFNSHRVRELGVGFGLRISQCDAEGLAWTLNDRVLRPGVRRRAERLGVRIAAERGVELCCELVEAALSHPLAADSEPQWRVPSLAEMAAGAKPESASRPAESGRTPIPRLLHQTWKDERVPPEFAAWQRSWRELNPGWEFRLWTDETNRELIRRHYPWFLTIYDGYAEPIMRADAVRAFILHRYGGVYADLDYECFRPLDPLLEGRELVLCLEPELHRLQHFSERGEPRLVCNAFMASVPAHPFWEHLQLEFVRSHEESGPLAAAGPFPLSHACESYPRREQLHLEPAERLCPIVGNEPFDLLPPDARERIAATAWAVHHWNNGWVRPPARSDEGFPMTLFEGGRQVAAATVAAEWLLSQLLSHVPLPLVSCLMVTRGRPQQTRQAVESFLRQSYPNRELVILEVGTGETLGQDVAQLADPRIRHRRLPDRGLALRELRIRAAAEARGAFIAQWDDHDFAGPKRLEAQVAALLAAGAGACFLERSLLWWPDGRRLGISGRESPESAALLASAAFREALSAARENLPLTERLAAGGRIVLLDAPWLNVGVRYERDSAEAAVWERRWSAATGHLEGLDYDNAVDHLDAWREGARPAAPAGDAPVPALAFGSISAAPEASAARPRVLALCPVKDAVPFLPRFLQNLRALAWPKERLSLAFLESDSIDGTHAWIEERLPALRREFASVELFRRGFGYRPPVERWDPGEQLRRRGIMARSRNLLLARALREEEWVLWLDVDVLSWPADALERLVGAGRDIVVPHCVSAATGETFDLNTFVHAPGAQALDWGPFTTAGLIQPPRSFGRRYLGEFPDHEMVEVDGVGGTMLLVRADLHREGLVFPAAPYRGYIETEGLAAMARDLGVRAWGMPGLEIVHP